MYLTVFRVPVHLSYERFDSNEYYWNNWLYHHGKRMLSNMNRCTHCGSVNCRRGRGQVCD